MFSCCYEIFRSVATDAMNLGIFDRNETVVRVIGAYEDMRPAGDVTKEGKEMI